MNPEPKGTTHTHTLIQPWRKFTVAHPFTCMSKKSKNPTETLSILFKKIMNLKVELKCWWCLKKTPQKTMLSSIDLLS